MRGFSDNAKVKNQWWQCLPGVWRQLCQLPIQKPNAKRQLFVNQSAKAEYFLDRQLTQLPLHLLILLFISPLMFAQLPEPPLETQPSPTPALPTSPDQTPLPYSETPAAELKSPAPKKGPVNVTFIGGKTFTEDQMRSAIADTLRDIESQGLSDALADDAAFFLANYYRDHGYSQVDVTYETRGGRLLLKINEGPLIRIGNVAVTGNRQVSTAKILEYVLGPTHQRFPRESKNPQFVEGDIESGVGWLRTFYTSQGFLNSTVDAPAYAYPGNGLVNVTVHVNEGTKYTFGAVTFSGELIFPKDQLLKQLGDYSTKPYTAQEVLRMEQVLEYYYKTKGYFRANVVSSSQPETAAKGRVPVNFYIESDDQYRFDDISVTGLVKLKPDFLPKRFRNLKGKLYNPELLDKKTREMTRTGLFKSFRTHEVEQPDHTVRLDINVEEAKAKELGFLLGYSTLEGALAGASYRDRNLFGEGRPLTTNAQYSTRGLRGEIAYDDPWFTPFGINDLLILRLRLYALTRQWDGYSKLEEGFRAELAHKFTDQFEISTFVLARHVNLQDVLISPDVHGQLKNLYGKERARRREELREELVGPTSYQVNSVGFSENYDTRDSKINPTKGYFLNAAIDSALDAFGSQITFLRATISSSYYLSLGKPGLLAFGARAGIINPLHARASIPIDERFFNGGSLSVRSFTERHLGPKDRNGFPVGGDSFTVFNVEYDFPIKGELEGATFVDAGSLGTGNDFGQIRYGIGVGLRYRLPIGPLRLDYAVNPTRKRDESIGAFHFSFGFAF